jgi:hypothetical protein
MRPEGRHKSLHMVRFHILEVSYEIYPYTAHASAPEYVGNLNRFCPLRTRGCEIWLKERKRSKNQPMYFTSAPPGARTHDLCVAAAGKSGLGSPAGAMAVIV